MADGVILDAMSGGRTVATDEISGQDYQRIKLIHGADGVNAGDVSTANGLPVQVLSVAAGDNNIGNVDIVSSALPSGASTSALQTTGNTALDAIKTAVEIIDNAIAGSEMQVDVVTMPSVAINNFPAGFLAAQSGSWTVGVTGSVAVTGTFFQATQPVSIASLPALAASTNNIGDVDVLTLPALPSGTNNIGDVDVLTLPALPTGSNVIGAVTQSGTWNVGTVTTVTTVSAVTAITNALPAGTNAIGKLAANSGVDIGDVDVTSQPARTRTADAISVAQQTDALMNGLTALTPKFATVSGAASGDNALVTAVTSKKIRVLSLFLMSAGTVNAYIRDDAGSPVSLVGDATNKLTLVAGSGFVLPPNPLGWFETTSGEGLQLNLSAAIGVAGCVSYVEV